MSREAEIAGYRRRWEQGDFRAVLDAFEHFHNWSEALPDWLANAVWMALQLAYEVGGAPGKGRTGTFKAQAARNDLHWWRWLVASSWLANRPVRLIDGKPKRMTREDALEGAREQLAGTPYRGSASAILASYHKVERLRKKG